MSDQALTQDEVDALLRGVTGETEEAVETKPQDGIRTYDIGREERIVRGRMPGLELINERAARQLRQGLQMLVRRSVDIVVGPVRVEKYVDFIRGLVVPTNFNLVSLEPLKGTALFIFDPNLVFRVVDNLFGGSGKVHMRVEGREFTATEQRVIERLVKIAFQAFDPAWQPVHPVTHTYLRSEMNPQFVNIANATEVVVVTTSRIDLPEGGGDLHICLPYSMIEPLRGALTSSMQGAPVEADARWLHLLREQIGEAEVPVEVELTRIRMSLRQIVDLQAGDMIPIDMPSRVSGRIDGVPAFSGRLGSSRGHYAIRIDTLPTSSED